MKLIEELFKLNKNAINKVNIEIANINATREVSGITYSFVSCTLSEAQSFTPTITEYRHITNARKSGEGVGSGTGLPAFYDVSSGDWLDFTGNPIQV